MPFAVIYACKQFILIQYLQVKHVKGRHDTQHKSTLQKHHQVSSIIMRHYAERRLLLIFKLSVEFLLLC